MLWLACVWPAVVLLFSDWHVHTESCDWHVRTESCDWHVRTESCDCHVRTESCDWHVRTESCDCHVRTESCDWHVRTESCDWQLRSAYWALWLSTRRRVCPVPPTIEIADKSTRHVVVGDTVTLPCAASGVPKPRIMWQKGTRLLGNTPGNSPVPLVTVFTSPTFQFYPGWQICQTCFDFWECTFLPKS